jgi:CRISPR-associated protein Csa1
MFFASPDEQRYAQRALREEARRQPVADELRGWSWHQPPLKPVYAAPLAMEDMVGQGCPTGRDVFLQRVHDVHATPESSAPDALLHRVVADLFVQAKHLVYAHGVHCMPHLERLANWPPPDAPHAVGANGVADPLRAETELLRAFETRRVLQRVEDVLAHHPRLGPDALAVLALPFSLDVALDGSYLGLSRHLCAAAVAFPEMLVLDLQFGPSQPFHRLLTTVYALVLESLFHTPVDVGCVVYARCEDGRVLVERDFHVIGDELRQTFIQERDDRMRAVAEELDPGLPEQCVPYCPFLSTCRPSRDVRPARPERPVSANRRHRLPAAAVVGG